MKRILADDDRLTMVAMTQNCGVQNAVHQGMITSSGLSRLILQAVLNQVSGLRESRMCSASLSRSGASLLSLSVLPGNSHPGYWRLKA
jgi:hypothetical protein